MPSKIIRAAMKLDAAQREADMLAHAKRLAARELARRGDPEAASAVATDWLDRARRGEVGR